MRAKNTNTAESGFICGYGTNQFFKCEGFFSVGYVDKLYSKIDNQNRVADLPQDNFKLISLPLVLTNAKYPNDGVGVAGVYFTPKNAFVNLVSRNTQGDIFVGTNIPATPYGLKSGAYLVPLHISANRSGGEK